MGLVDAELIFRTRSLGLAGYELGYRFWLPRCFSFEAQTPLLCIVSVIEARERGHRRYSVLYYYRSSIRLTLPHQEQYPAF